MQLDPTICNRARLSRDERFDGQFYTAVITTGIYCRPTCPAGPAKEENVRYYQSATHAEFNGFQPCKRCKPELAPGQKLPSILDQALEYLTYQPQLSVLQLAQKLAISERQLQRLFIEKIGLKPKQFINQKRQINARNLLLTTSLQLNDIAIISGFGSLRSFNEQIKAQYGITPLAIRKSSKAKLTDNLSIKLNYKGELNWPLMLDFLANRKIPNIEFIEHSYQRTINIDNSTGWLEVSKPTKQNYLLLNINLDNYCALPKVIYRIRKMFDLDCDLLSIQTQLKKDADLAKVIDKVNGLRLPGCWDIFEFSIRAILGQQISVKAATTLAGRIAEKYGTAVQSQGASAGKTIDNTFPEQLSLYFPTYQQLLKAEFSDIGITNTRQQTLKTWVNFYSENIELFAQAQDSDSFEQKLCQVKGIGPWTANYLAMRGLGLPDAFPAADLGIIKALAKNKNTEDEQRPTTKEILSRAESWRPWRAYAAIYLWYSLSL
ncbi:DNA-3-methyladenine glycosylase 2 family protein [Thalassomonas sp. M1454]|uniref:DNA-3-methyladenine glycosylase 2 family protein n=1 Tax=Thalassomonas sp. M1454 TaxID=2594477 RepID=UPI00117F53B8|nr:DNA-3-methyladenine glycosylase 2 [Thalassomonas sp. M1454]TRX55723.1 DNA-3-methyladenine glycosylase 2 family protein [Thalassomonas sp. M1454]